MDAELYRRLDYYISLGNAGPCDELAKKLDIKERQVKHMLNVMRSDFYCPIEYDYSKKSYYYTEVGRCRLQFESSKLQLLLENFGAVARQLFASIFIFIITI